MEKMEIVKDVFDVLSPARWPEMAPRTLEIYLRINMISMLFNIMSCLLMNVYIDEPCLFPDFWMIKVR